MAKFNFFDVCINPALVVVVLSSTVALVFFITRSESLRGVLLLSFHEGCTLSPAIFVSKELRVLCCAMLVKEYANSSSCLKQHQLLQYDINYWQHSLSNKRDIVLPSMASRMGLKILNGKWLHDVVEAGVEGGHRQHDSYILTVRTACALHL